MATFCCVRGLSSRGAAQLDAANSERSFSMQVSGSAAVQCSAGPSLFRTSLVTRRHSRGAARPQLNLDTGRRLVVVSAANKSGDFIPSAGGEEEKGPSLVKQSGDFSPEKSAGGEEEKGPSLVKQVLAEFLGTFLLIFVSCAAPTLKSTEQLSALAASLVPPAGILALISVLSHVSGAHFNPAISIAMAVTQGFPVGKLPAYISAQFGGAVLGAQLSFAIYGPAALKAMVIQPLCVCGRCPGASLKSLFIEMVLTSVLGFTATAMSSGDVEGVPPGVVLAGVIFVAGSISGASLNPARSLGPAIVSGIFTDIFVYMIGPVVGAIIGSATYKFIRQ